MRSRGWMVAVGVLCLGVVATRGGDHRETATAGPKAPTDVRVAIQRAKERVYPALVHVRCIRETRKRGTLENEQVGGSGVLISKEGEFLTNWHVVDKAVEIHCLLHDGRVFPAHVIGTDQETDLGLCRIDAPADTTFPLARFGDSTALSEGDFVMALGAPWGLSRSVSLGILSCGQRFLPGHSEYSLWLQTDAAISPGNSGGPLIDTQGRVIGINARGVMRGGDMGFAIPSDTIVQVIPLLRAHGRVPWGWTGLRLQPLHDFERDMYFPAKDGVIVSGTDPDSPARAADVRSNDRIRFVNERPVTAAMSEDLPALRRALALLPIGVPVKLGLVRGGAALDVELTPRAKGSTEGKEFDLPRWDFSVKQINRFANPGLYLHRKLGLFVHGVRRPGNAKTSGLRRGDILLRIGKTEIVTIDDLQAQHASAIAGLAKQSSVLVSVLRGGLLHQVVLEFGRDFERK